MGARSNRKGARGELEWRDFLRRHGFTAERRGYEQRDGVRIPDVVADLPVAWEVKRCERGFSAVYAALDQAACQRFGHAPAVAFRQNQREWVVSLRAEDFLELVRKGEHTDGV